PARQAATARFARAWGRWSPSSGRLSPADDVLPPEAVAGEARDWPGDFSVIHSCDLVDPQILDPGGHPLELSPRVRLRPLALHVPREHRAEAAPRSTREERMPHPEAVADPRVARVHHHAELAARTQHADRLAHGLPGLGGVMQHP